MANFRDVFVERQLGLCRWAIMIADDITWGYASFDYFEIWSVMLFLAFWIFSFKGFQGWLSTFKNMPIFILTSVFGRVLELGHCLYLKLRNIIYIQYNFKIIHDCLSYQLLILLFFFLDLIWTILNLFFFHYCSFLILFSLRIFELFLAPVLSLKFFLVEHHQYLVAYFYYLILFDEWISHEKFFGDLYV